jgi:protein-tyrosine phosphatase
LRAAASQGTTTVVATPHCSARYATPAAAVAGGVAEMRAVLVAAGVPLDLRRGSEIAVDMAMQLPDDDLRLLTLGGSRCVLLESPLEPAVGEALERCVEDLHARGYRVMLAHPERAPAFLNQPLRLRALVEAGVLCSVTAASLNGLFGEGPHWFALELLRDGLVHSIDSDAHDAELRPPTMLEGLAAAADALPHLATRMRWLTTDLPAALLADEPLPPAP